MLENTIIRQWCCALAAAVSVQAFPSLRGASAHQGQRTVALAKIKVAQETHAEQDFMTAHAWIDVGKHIAHHDRAKSHFIDSGQIGGDRSVRGVRLHCLAPGKRELPGKPFRDRDCGCAGVEQEHCRLAIQGAGRDVVTHAILSQPHLSLAVTACGFDTGIWIVSIVKQAAEQHRDDADDNDPAQANH